RDVPDPEPGPEEVRVAVTGAGVNRADLLQRMGFYPGPPMAHEIPGMEFAGRVESVGERVAGWSVGDEVMGIVGGGAYAERLCVHERQCMPVPERLALEDAAAVPEVFVTAYDALVWQGGLTTGRRALVHAGASGVGTAAIQLAKAVGAEVAVTASTSKVDACRDLGADLVVDYTAEDFAERVGAWAPDGVDVVLDVIGGDYVNRNIACTRTKGRIIQVGVMGAGRAEVDVGTLLRKRIALVGTVLRARPLEEKIDVTQRFTAEVLPRFTDGSLKPVIDSRYPLDEVAAAHQRMESNANVGKLLLDL
ncbi:MAG TPA: NAD(P)H-quinone oxidoreductase, partial [Acidimicrobiales bacterium]|nr:NAD(P)H-quinone oxidoreductase [Acidimicrobiales bacterium]